MAPQLRAMFNNPQFREMLSNPDALRQMFQMSAQMRSAGVDPMSFGSGLGGLGGFGLPPFGLGASGVGAAGSNATGTTAGSGPTNLFSQAAAGSGTGGGAIAGTGGGGGTEAGSPPPNPFGMVDPNLMAQLVSGYGGFGGFPGPGAGSTPSAPSDTRPVEERFQVGFRPLRRETDDSSIDTDRCSGSTSGTTGVFQWGAASSTDDSR